jgi:hypothetical protein
VADEETKEQRQTLQKRVALKEDGYYANCAMVRTRMARDLSSTCTIGRSICPICRRELCVTPWAGASAR